MGIEQDFRNYRRRAEESGQATVPDRLQGITKLRVQQVLKKIDLDTAEMVNVVWALLDDRMENMFKKAAPGMTFADGASTAQIGCHVNILQRGFNTKMDREGRDYWIKPLTEIGAIEKVFFISDESIFIPGHPIAKSPNSAYRLSESFHNVLTAPEDQLEQLLDLWISEDRTRERLNQQAEAAASAKTLVRNDHAELIAACIEHYVRAFLPYYEVLFKDAEDGDRLRQEEIANLENVGISMKLDDPWPDVLLHHVDDDRIWIIEAVTSDGEVDNHKVEQVQRFAHRNGKTVGGFTTAYLTWKAAALRQGKNKNIAVGTYVWILEDASRHLYVDDGNSIVPELPNSSTH